MHEQWLRGALRNVWMVVWTQSGWSRRVRRAVREKLLVDVRDVGQAYRVYVIRPWLSGNEEIGIA